VEEVPGGGLTGGCICRQRAHALHKGSCPLQTWQHVVQCSQLSASECLKIPVAQPAMHPLLCMLSVKARYMHDIVCALPPPLPSHMCMTLPLLHTPTSSPGERGGGGHVQGVPA
jgi:hypothetical protein